MGGYYVHISIANFFSFFFPIVERFRRLLLLAFISSLSASVLSALGI